MTGLAGGIFILRRLQLNRAVASCILLFMSVSKILNSVKSSSFAGVTIGAISVPGIIIIALLSLSACNQQSGLLSSTGSQSGAHTLLPVMAQSDWGDFIDPVSGFKARVPTGWTVLVMGDAHADNWYDSEGHAITFQSPPSSDTDIYSDYIMVEFLPSAPAAAFISDDSEQIPVSIDGRSTVRERIVLRDFPVESASIDLVAYQLLTAELGYSMGLYVVGELREDQGLAEIFSIFRENFVFPPDNLQVSQR